MRSPLRYAAARQHGAFSTRQILSCYTRDELRARVRSQQWKRVFTGSYRHAGSEPTARLRVHAAGLSIGRPVPACLHTAAELLGFGVLDDPVTHVVVGTALPCTRRDELWPHQLLIRPGDVTTLRCATATTDANRTAVDLARTLRRLDALPILDAALAAGACTPEALAAEIEHHTGLPGVRRARALVDLADARAESPQESRMRLLCHDAGLPPPTPQLPVRDDGGRVRRWLDLGWEEAKVGLEYDGADHDGAARRRSDRRRQNWFTDRGWDVYHATDADVFGNPAPLMAQLATALARRSPRYR
ncbi:hypothetical protein ACVGVM_03280 [Pseudonocardia bannensis]|uniref:DUF559 domain-containing protein n=1 Tax=Pseudonocardia bannensis TaxID=630973 RepID=A0A848DST2_9PSEU|nr:hypothetical protein [Pseudonocardia bannensis]NMH95466.1 hypothetical protein [Pseudonocardia bannensis]